MANNSDTNYYDLMDCEHGDEEEDLATGCSDSKDATFDAVIGYIEEIVMEDDFQRLQNNFMEKYFQEFDDSEENKFCYTDIHKEYVELVEKYLEDEIVKRIPEFSMDEFIKTLALRKDELEGEIFELLLTFSDFLAFKELILDFKAEKEGRTVDLSCGITVTPMHNDDIPMEGAGLSLGGHRFGQQ